MAHLKTSENTWSDRADAVVSVQLNQNAHCELMDHGLRPSESLARWLVIWSCLLTLNCAKMRHTVAHKKICTWTRPLHLQGPNWFILLVLACPGHSIVVNKLKNCQQCFLYWLKWFVQLCFKLLRSVTAILVYTDSQKLSGMLFGSTWRFLHSTFCQHFSVAPQRVLIISVCQLPFARQC